MLLLKGRAGVLSAIASCAGLLVGCAHTSGVPGTVVRGTAAPAPWPSAPGVALSVDAATAGAQLNEDLLGTNWLNPGPGEARMRAIGLRTDRIPASLDGNDDGTPIYDCATGVWDSRPLDAMVAAARRVGATAEVIVGSMPPCLAPPGSQAGVAAKLPPAPGTATAAWEELVRKLAAHEIAGGVRAFEIWNEPDWVFFAGTQQQYFTLYAETSTALERAATAAHVRIEVGGPTIANVLGAMDTGWLNPFLDYVDAHHLPLDFLSWHLYPNDPLAGPSDGMGAICLGGKAGPGANPCYYKPTLHAGAFADSVALAHQALASHPDLHPQIWIDEWNVDAEYDPREDTSYDAAFVLTALASADAAGVSRMAYYDMADGNDPKADFGMLDARYRPKPVYDAFGWWHDCAGRFLALTASPQQNPGGSGGVGSFATVSPDGTVRVVLTDFVPYETKGDYGSHEPSRYDRIVHLRITRLGAGAYRAVVERIGAAPRGAAGVTVTVSHGSARAAVYLPEEGSVLVTLVPEGAAGS